MERLENFSDEVTEGRRYDFIFYSFRYFEPVEFLENRSDVVMFWGFSESTGESILNSLEAVYLDEVYVQEERATVVQFSVDYRCSDGRCSCAAVVVTPLLKYIRHL